MFKTMISLQTDDILLKEDIKMEAVSPNGRVIKMSGVGTYNAQFEPDEIGNPWYYKVFRHKTECNVYRHVLQCSIV